MLSNINYLSFILRHLIVLKHYNTPGSYRYWYYSNNWYYSSLTETLKNCSKYKFNLQFIINDCEYHTNMKQYLISNI